MSFPVDIGGESVRRGDSWAYPVPFNHEPPAWATSTEYVVGTVGSADYVENSTVTYEDVAYTCTTAHTSGSTFDATKWTADPKAVGAPWDLSQLGTVVTAQARKRPNDAPLLTFDTSGSNLAAGLVSLAIAPSDWAVIPAKDFSRDTDLGFDVQIADADGSRVTTVLVGKLTVNPDYTYDSYGAS